MNKCCFGVITIWHCLTGLRSNWGSKLSHHLRNYNINTFNSFIISSSLTSLSMSLSIGKLGPITPNVNDGQCQIFEIYVLEELEAFLNVDTSILLKRLVLSFKHIFIYFSFQKSYNIFYIGNAKVSRIRFQQGPTNMKLFMCNECLLLFVDFLFTFFHMD
jgi:hypothetical protein